MVQLLVIQPVKFLGEVFHASDSTNFLQDERDYLRREIERLHAEVDRERKERTLWQEMFHRQIGITSEVRERATPQKFESVAKKRPWNDVVREFHEKERKKQKEANNE